MKITYRPAIPSDALQLSLVFHSVYIYTYGQEGVSTEFANFIHEQFNIAKIKKEITAPETDLIIALYKNNPIGIVKIENNKKSPVGDFTAPEINKLYLLSHFIGKGIGHQLLKEAENFLEKKGEKEVWLWVYIKNKRAIDFYKRQLYEEIGEAWFEMEENNYLNKVFKKKLGKKI